MLKIKLKIGGMGCANCEKAVEKALLQLKGVKAVKANAASGIAEIEAEVLDRPLLYQAVEDAGYELKAILE